MNENHISTIRHADRIYVLDKGRVVQQGTFADLAHKPAEPFVTEFLSAQAPPPELREWF